jgi:hypothetical protein
MKILQSVQGIINSRLSDYERRISIGFKYAVFVNELENEGIKISVRYFSNCINKARKLATSSPSPQENKQPEKTASAHQPIVNTSQKKEGFTLPKIEDVDFN